MEIAAVDLFAGPGGWDEGIRELGIRPVGVERDASACATRAKVGHRTVQGDVSELDPADYTPCELLIASPPCPTFSNAGGRAGHEVIDILLGGARDLMRGIDDRDEAREAAYKVLLPLARDAEYERATRRGDVPDYERAARNARAEAAMSLLIIEPLRWIHALQPRWVALEQVPPAIEVWRVYADMLALAGWRCWAGILNSERYGVPQTRQRAILIADRERQPHPPRPTHQEYVSGQPAREDHTLEGTILPWLSMAEALGWAPGFNVVTERGAGMNERHGERNPRRGDEPAPVVTASGSRWSGGPRWRLEERQEENGAARDADEPAPTLTAAMDNGNFRFLVNTGRDWKEGGSREDAQTFDAAEQPAPTVDGKGRWHVKTGANSMKHSREGSKAGEGGGAPYERDVADPAPTLDGKVGAAWRIEPDDWPHDRPSTTIQGDARVFSPGGHIANDGRDNAKMVGRSENAIRVELADAAVLQGFPHDYPFQGTKSKQFEQVGNAVPPPLARAIIEALVLG